MAISDKILYLNDTKKLLKQEINKSTEITDEDTFRSYAPKIYDGYLDMLNNGTETLWNNLEKVSASGEEATLENVETAPIKMVLNGNTSQETTSGKNLQAPLSSSTTMNGVTFTPIFKDGLLQYVNVNGTSTGVAYVDLPDINFSAGTYIMTGSPSGGSDSNYQQRFVTGTSNLGTDNGNGVSVTLNEATSCHVRIRIASGYTANNLKFYPMVRLSSITDNTYEPYTGGQPSPSPDFPQQVKVVKGENVVSVQGKNWLGLTNGTYSHNGITAVVNDGTITITGTATANSFVNIPLIKDIVLSNEQVTVSINNATTISDTATEFRVYESGTNYIPVLFTTIDRKTTTTKTGTFVSAYVRTTSGVSYGSGLVIKPQLELGSTATPYVPYSKIDYPIDLVAENLFDKDDARILRGYIDVNNKVTKISNNDYSVIVKVKPNTNYIVTKMTNNPESQAKFRLGTSTNYPQLSGAVDNSFNQVISNDTATELSITTDANDNYLVVFCYTDRSTTTLEEMLDSLVVREAEPIYKEMCKIGNYKDYFHKDNGKWYVHKEIGKVILDGSESWNKASEWSDIGPNSNAYTSYKSTMPNVKTNAQGISNYFIHNAKAYATDVNGLFQFSTFPIFRISKAIAPTTTDFKNWLSTHNSIVYYQLATPTETEITNTTLIEQLEAISKAKSVKDKTYITQTNDELPFILDVEAIKEYEKNLGNN